MMKTFTLSATVMFLVAVPVAAQVKDYSQRTRDGVTTTKERLQQGKDIETITCRQFNALEDAFKPQAIVYAAKYSKKGKAKDPVIDVAGLEDITPVVVRECKTRTSEPLLTRIRDAFRRKH